MSSLNQTPEDSTRHQDIPESGTSSDSEIGRPECPVSPEDLGNCTRSVSEICTNLQSFSRSAEDKFLSLGSDLQGFHTQARSISRTAADVAQQFSGPAAEALMGELRDIFDQVRTMEDRSQQGRITLEDILGRFDEMRRAAQSFEKIVKMLNVVCVMMRIENARIAELESGFQTVAEDVRNLARKILEKTQELVDRSSRLGAVIRQDLEHLRRAEQSRTATARRIIDETSTSLDILADRHRASSRSLQQIAESYNQLSRNISEIVSSLQFHDITRQRLEHVAEALEDVSKIIQMRRPPDPAEAAPEAERGSDGQTAAARGLGSAVTICRLQEAHAEHAGREFVAAVERIITNLQSVAERAGEIAEQSGLIVADADSAGDRSSFLGQLDERMNHLGSQLSEYGVIHGKMAGIVQHVTGTTQEMSRFIDEIEDIGTLMRIVALNAQINSAHIGDQGLSLGVLAGEVQAVVNDTGERIRGVSEGLAAVVSLAGTLSNGGGQSAASVQSVGSILRRASRDLHRIHESTDAMVEDLRRTGLDLRQRIDGTVSGIDVQERAWEEIQGTSDRLAGLRSVLGRYVSDEELQAAESSFRELEHRYTMEEERRIHEMVLGGRAGGSEVATADDSADDVLFGDEPVLFEQEPVLFEADSPLSRDSQESAGDDLGDNVELF